MGSSAKTKHEAYTVAPAVTETAVPAPLVDILAGLTLGSAPLAGIEAAKDAHAVVLAFTSNAWEPNALGYTGFAGNFVAAKSVLLYAQEAGAPVQIVQDDWDALKTFTKEYLTQLPVAELEALAAEKGFQHPGLIGLHTPEGKTHPLAYWLDPYYGPDAPGKQGFQDKALERWELLKSGGTVEGMTLADYLAAHPDEQVDEGASALTPVQLEELWEKIQAAKAVCVELYYEHGEGQDETRAQAKLDYHVLRHVHTAAVCTDTAYFKATEATPYQTHIQPPDLAYLKPRLADEFGIAPLDADLIMAYPYGHSLEAYLFDGETQKKSIDSYVAAKKEAITEVSEHAKFAFDALVPMLGGWHPAVVHPLALPGGGGESPAAATAAVEDFLAHYPKLREAAAKTQTGGNGVLGIASVQELVLPGAPAETAAKITYLSSAGKKIPAAFRLWAKNQPISFLRNVAVAAGMAPEQAKVLTRAQVQNYLVGKFDWKSQAKFEASLVTPAPKASISAPPTSPTSVAAPTVIPTVKVPAPAPKVTAGIMMPANATFAEKRSSMAAGLQHLAAAMAVIPDRPTSNEVAALKLTETAAPVHGGAHSKSFFADEKGRTWMFKPDPAGGARAAAETAAAEIFHRVGLPAVPVYSRTVAGKVGSIQPIVAHSGTLSDSPKAWSQADVDSMVRYHVASWIVGDHDGKSDNMLRTPGGGIVAIDQGQAWKFVGRDKLDVDYHPNSSFGAMPPVYHQAYKASLAGGLGAGVSVRPEAATPVVERFEAMADDDFRKIVQPVATLGVKAKLPWVAPMTDEAKKRFATAAPSAAQVADCFVEHLVERKKNLREDFAGFFTKLGIAGSHHLEKVA